MNETIDIVSGSQRESVCTYVVWTLDIFSNAEVVMGMISANHNHTEYPSVQYSDPVGTIYWIIGMFMSAHSYSLSISSVYLCTEYIYPKCPVPRCRSTYAFSGMITEPTCISRCL